MKELSIDDLNEWIESKKNHVDRTLLNLKSERTIRTRTRDAGESRILDRLCKKKFEQALVSGKVRIINSKEWYYEAD
ncbi:hypothetical protein LSG31_19045 [Fodinisporobacter ferrooxydans]|uniref:Uncharacterized protein n=1 Tax=Fodinisporobacter ferrooxydans TaxID=2901836 RepID=A0ABY4CQ26_9BACL|nr:hypothetical protein LSG31_19045 [Alicyclobacillaceae bacterium MYW30-H2]